MMKIDSATAHVRMPENSVHLGEQVRFTRKRCIGSGKPMLSQRRLAGLPRQPSRARDEGTKASDEGHAREVPRDAADGVGYTRTELFVDPKKPGTVSHVLWSVYVLERRPEGWRIVSLDWSIARQK
jgi:hypothetical protein